MATLEKEKTSLGERCDSKYKSTYIKNHKKIRFGLVASVSQIHKKKIAFVDFEESSHSKSLGEGVEFSYHRFWDIGKLKGKIYL